MNEQPQQPSPLGPNLQLPYTFRVPWSYVSAYVLKLVLFGIVAEIIIWGFNGRYAAIVIGIALMGFGVYWVSKLIGQRVTLGESTIELQRMGGPTTVAYKDVKKSRLSLQDK